MFKNNFILTRRIMTIVIIISIIGVIASVLRIGLMYAKEEARRSTCGCNLNTIGQALAGYANQNNGNFPMLPLGKGHIIGEDRAVVNNKINALDEPFTDLPQDASKSVSMNIWLLCRSNLATAPVFICPSVRKSDHDFEELFGDGKNVYSPLGFTNFPWNKPGAVISFSFPQPWSNTVQWNTQAPPGTIVGADGNNGSEPNYSEDGLPLSNRKLKKYVNSRNHWEKSQNLLFLDGHVGNTPSPYVGLDQDNIFTAQPPGYTGKAGNTAGVLVVRPKDTKDVVLIPNKDSDLEKWDRQP